MKTRSSDQRHAAKLHTWAGAITTLLAAGYAAINGHSPSTILMILIGLGVLASGTYALITSGHSLRWHRTWRHHGIWTTKCRHCPGTHTRGPLQAALRGARAHQHYQHTGAEQ